ncbi:hypothetical protein CP97_00015 [Aurantiacibacter atlanticus]|uniref:Uncharacterized protein n=1 Tax=Aurantiacibacter atlanticus TaxID=1648404 RepID=A0A0H4VD59_9SPHN|nr:hypothetical protein CP97_00015 [Aurantiacibacter atlanticus]
MLLLRTSFHRPSTIASLSRLTKIAGVATPDAPALRAQKRAA